MEVIFLFFLNFIVYLLVSRPISLCLNFFFNSDSLELSPWRTNIGTVVLRNLSLLTKNTELISETLFRVKQ